jgi:surface polysaccharide O-acyltransferase-like enzyme
MSGEVNNQVGVKDLLLIPIVPLSTLWFIYALLIFWLIRMIVCKVQVPHGMMIISSIILCIIASHIIFSVFVSSTIIPRLMKYGFYYSVGVALAEVGFKRTTLIKRGWIAAIVWAMLFTFKHYVDIKQVMGVYSILLAICGIVIVVWISEILKDNYLANLGRSSLGIYLMHDYFVCFSVIALRHLLENSTIIILISFFAGTICPYLIYKFCITNSFLCYIFQPQKIIGRRE